jgi:hydrogenase maturation protein HypF
VRALDEGRRLRVRGAVQGVGFRPYDHGLVTSLSLSGFVRNDGEGVLIEVEGPEAHAFLTELEAIAPAECADALLAAMKAHPLGAQASAFGRAVGDSNRFVEMRTAFGGGEVRRLARRRAAPPHLLAHFGAAGRR